ncbi:DUF1513 domain-containing protein [Sagittula sp. SSi028]|uniref:DUF1513 domain-containing protein n=1 Tax=Sagittula sp. SSi028 TaxID=3400636 RepID=UPI003AF45760
MLSRRGMLRGLMAAGLCPAPTWADTGSPRYLAAAQALGGGYELHGFDRGGQSLFAIALPDRGHAAAAHPTQAVAVGFARRPGTYALVIDCALGAVQTRLTAPEGRHFYGHGAYTQDGRYLFTTENAFDTAEGRIGVWDALDGYRRVGEFASGGVGPHEMLLMPDGETLAVANGGIETHPDAGRAKLNIPFMEPNLSYLTLTGALLEQVAPPAAEHKNSLRHIASGPDGQIAAALQWEGDVAQAPALLMLHSRGETPIWCRADGADHDAMDGYAGSVSFSGSGAEVAITSPRGGRVQVFDARDGQLLRQVMLDDVCGLAPHEGGFVASTGGGEVFALHGDGAVPLSRAELAWDNHIVAL